MKWTEPSHWLEFAEEATTSLLGLEPTFFEANIVLRMLLIFIVAKFFYWLLMLAIKIIALLVHQTLGIVASSISRWFIYEIGGNVAQVYIKAQAATLWIIRPPETSPQLFDQMGNPIHPLERIGTTPPRPLRVLKNRALSFVAILAMWPLAIVGTGIFLLFSIVRNFVSINMLNIASAFTALWLTGILDANTLITDLRLADIPISSAVAIGTLLALAFVALNTDVRGKAELNKVASLKCRVTLHETAPKLLRIADTLYTTRHLASRRLIFFPTMAELVELTGRSDLCWRGAHLLPQTATLVARPDATLYTKILKIAHRVHQSCRSPYDLPDSSIIRRDEMPEQHGFLMAESSEIVGALSELYKSGMADKLSRALNPPAYYFLINLFREGFGDNSSGALYLQHDQHWYEYILDEETSVEIHRRWSNLALADPDDPGLHKECDYLEQLLRSTVYGVKSALWCAAVDEYRLRYLAHAINSSLRPKIFERIRQFFDK